MGRKAKKSSSHWIRARAMGTASGAIFARPTQGGEDFYLDMPDLVAMDGDEILIQPTSQRGERPRATLEAVEKRLISAIEKLSTRPNTAARMRKATTAARRAAKKPTATELSERCGVDRAQISRVVSELERDGLTGEASPGEKRRYRGRLRLTEAGARKAEAMNALVAEKLNAVAGDLNPYDVQTFYKVLRQINERLEGV